MNNLVRSNSKAPEPFTTLRSGAVFCDEQEMFLHAEAPSFYTLSLQRHEHTNFVRGVIIAALIGAAFWTAIFVAIHHFNR